MVRSIKPFLSKSRMSVERLLRWSPTAAAICLGAAIGWSKLVLFDGNTDLVAGVRAQAAYGHTPGHTMYMVESKGQRLLLWGDIVHVAAVQFDSPAVTIGYDVDAADAEREHWRQFADAADKGYLIGGAHISFPGLGRVRRDGEGTYVYVPLNYSAGMG
jgi:glyoxylase-like metal-dependent hydrolase (beta-lactamase superfamily II)